MIPSALILAQLLFGTVRLVTDSTTVRLTDGVSVPNGPYSETVLASYLVGLGEVLDEAGYWYHQIRLQAAWIDSSAGRMHIEITIEAGDPVVSSFIRLDGGRRFASEDIRGRFADPSGQILTGNRMRAFRRDLMATGLFRSVAEPQVVVADGRDGVSVVVDELPPGSVDGVVGSNQGTVVGSFDLTLRHVLAIGHRIDLRFDRSRPLESSLDVTTSWYRIRNRPFSAEAGFHLFQQDSTFLIRRISAAVDVADLRGRSVGYWAEWRTSYAGSVPPSGFAEGERWMSGVRARFHSLSDPFFPESGSLVRFKAGTGRRTGQRLSLSEADWLVVMAADTRSAWVLKGAAAVLLADTVRVDEQFRYGGAATFRGKAERGFSTDRYAWTELEHRFRFDRETYGFGFTGATIQGRVDPVFNLGFGFAYLTRIGLLSFTAASTSVAWGSPVIHVRVTTGL